MSIHPLTQKVVDYPDTIGKSSALKHYRWNNLDLVQETMVADDLLFLASMIDAEIAMAMEPESSGYIDGLVRDRESCLNDNLLHADKDELSEHEVDWKNELSDIEKYNNSYLEFNKSKKQL